MGSIIDSSLQGSSDGFDEKNRALTISAYACGPKPRAKADAGDKSKTWECWL